MDPRTPDRLNIAMELLANVTAALDTVMTFYNDHMPAGDQQQRWKLLAAAQSFLEAGATPMITPPKPRRFAFHVVIENDDGDTAASECFQRLAGSTQIGSEEVVSVTLETES